MSNTSYTGNQCHHIDIIQTVDHFTAGKFYLRPPADKHAFIETFKTYQIARNTWYLLVVLATGQHSFIDDIHTRQPLTFHSLDDIAAFLHQHHASGFEVELIGYEMEGK